MILCIKGATYENLRALSDTIPNGLANPGMGGCYFMTLVRQILYRGLSLPPYNLIKAWWTVPRSD